MRFLKAYKTDFLIKVFSVNSLGVALKSFLSLVSQKLIAIYLGPDGIALVGNLRNALALFGLGSIVGVDQGVIKYQSEYDINTEKLKKLYATSLAYSLVGSLLVGLILFFGATFWSHFILNTPDYNYLFIILAFTIPFTALYNLCFALVNGKSNYKKAILLSLSSSSIITLLIIVFTINSGLSGALLAIILTPISQIIVLLLFAKNEVSLILKFKPYFFKVFRSKLTIFSLMALVTVVFNNIIEIQLRNHLIEKLSKEDAGYWSSILNISNYYLLFLAGIYSVYILPKYAKIKTLSSFIIEVKQIYKVVIPVFSILLISIYFLRGTIISLLYTESFTDMQVLFKWQLIGDLVKIIAVILAYQFVAQKLWITFIITEVISFSAWYMFSIYFIDKMGVEGIVFAHFLRYILYLVIVVFSVRVFFVNKVNHENK